MSGTFKRYLVPGLVMRSVLVGATYSTGREVTEFFLKYGPFSALIGLVITTVLFSGFCFVALELARRYKVFDYKSFCEVYMGRLWFLYELGFLSGVMLTLSILGAAAGEVSGDLFGIPHLVGTWALMVAIALLVYLGTSSIEKIMSVWSIFFYVAYAVLVVLAVYHSGSKIPEKVTPAPITIGAVGSAAVYAGFCCAILPVVIFVARHLETRKDAAIAGIFSGPLVFSPALALTLVLIPYYPDITSAPVPIMHVLDGLQVRWLVALIKVAILGELAVVGAGLLHGVNERIAKTLEERNTRMSASWRAGFSLAALVFSVFLAERVGLIKLVATGFRYGFWAFLAVIVLPLFPRGYAMIASRWNSRTAS